VVSSVNYCVYFNISVSAYSCPSPKIYKGKECSRVFPNRLAPLMKMIHGSSSHGISGQEYLVLLESLHGKNDTDMK